MRPPARTEAETRVCEIASRIAEATGLELILAEFSRMSGRLIVRFTIDREPGVTIDDCAEFSRRVGAVLEAEDPIPGPYSLEVSSPGLDRRLVKPADFERFRDKIARVTLATPLDGRRNFQGLLKGLDGGEILMEIEGGILVRLPVEGVETARLVPEF